MHPDEIEEMEFSTENELQMAFRQSQRERVRDERIRNELKAGKFVIAVEYVDYCPRTDAFMGMAEAFRSSHETREEAEVAMNAINQHDDDEHYHVILPALTVPIQTFEEAFPDGLPF